MFNTLIDNLRHEWAVLEQTHLWTDVELRIKSLHPFKQNDAKVLWNSYIVDEYKDLEPGLIKMYENMYGPDRSQWPKRD